MIAKGWLSAVMGETDSSQGRLPGLRFSGPYLNAAVLCEKVLREHDGVQSVVRIIDRITVTVTGDAPAQMPPAQINLALYVLFKSGEARGTYMVGVRVVNPSGHSISTAAFPLLLEGEDRGAALIAQMNVQAEEEGVFWFEILLEDSVVTRVPLRVLYQRVVTSQKQGGG